MMSLPAPFFPIDNDMKLNYPISTSSDRGTSNGGFGRNSLNNYYMGHIYSISSTVPKEFLYWYSPAPLKSLTVTGESRSQVLKGFESALMRANLEVACRNGVELHCSGYFDLIFNSLINIVGKYVHIHNPNIGTKLLSKYFKFRNNLKLPKNKNIGTVQFPDDDDFYNRQEVLSYRNTLNCQCVRNFVIESISIVCLSHQKEMTVPVVNSKDLNKIYLQSVAESLNVGGKKIKRIIEKNELKVILEIIKKYLCYKTTRAEEAIYWISWLMKYEKKVKKNGGNLPCRPLIVQGIDKTERNHWVWYIWHSVCGRVSFYMDFKKAQIINLYKLFKINFSKKMIYNRIYILFFAIRLLKYDLTNNFPSVLNLTMLHLYIQAYSNTNALYRNLQIKLAKKSWVDVVGDKKNHENNSVGGGIKKKISKRKIKEIKNRNHLNLMNEKLSYLNIITSSEK